MADEQKATEQQDAVTEPAKVELEKPEATPRTRKPKERRETFEAVRPDGVTVLIDRNIDTGEQTVTEK